MQTLTQQPPLQPGPPGQGPAIAGSPSANAVYEAQRHANNVLREQQRELESQRRQLMRDVEQSDNAVSQKGLEQRIATVDQRLAAMDKQIADNEALVAKSAAVPGAVIEQPPPPPRGGPPEEAYALGAFFVFIVGLPLTIAYARRIWRRSAVAVTKLPQEIYDRFARVDQSLDAIAIEVERVGEGQRYLTRMHTEQGRALGAGPAERIDAVERERERQSRK
jgi:hypothetical protein